MLKNIFFIGFILFTTALLYSQEIKYKEYSYSEFFKMIEDEKDTIFELKDALINYNDNTDKDHISSYNYENSNNGNGYSYSRKDTIVINKELRLTNVQFIDYRTSQKNGNYRSNLHHIIFKKDVGFWNTTSIRISDCVFEKSVNIYNDNKIIKITDVVQREEFTKNRYIRISIRFNNVKIKENFSIVVNNTEKNFLDNNIYLRNVKLTSDSDKTESFIFANNINNVYIDDCKFKTSIRINTLKLNNVDIINSTFDKSTILEFQEINTISLEKNIFNAIVGFEIDKFPESTTTNIDWESFSNKIISWEGYRLNFIYRRDILKIQELESTFLQSDLLKKYKIESIFNDKKSYLREARLRAKFKSFYNGIYDLESVNKVYVEMKNLETERLAHVYNSDPTFKTFFTWKINQFLKVFSAYGTEPARAIIFSMWVILFFAFIYLLFPNSWDSHGRKRIMDRYAFFFTYMNKKAGMHEVYLDEQKEELLEFNEFKTLVKQQGKTVPKFFTATALPLYKWAISGKKFSASILRRVDIMKGTWNELPQSKRIWKSVLLITFFLIAILYDIFIKMLNALMLSINTFTTLGFGEIPIKGLPRYLAIIQGFIGWFMLTIFSVSLISQLLN